RSLPDPPLGEPRLESWGQIAAYLHREIRTVQRWERYHGLPVRRLLVGRLSTVYAYRSELDKWFRERQPRLESESEHDDSVHGSSTSHLKEHHPELSPFPTPNSSAPSPTPPQSAPKPSVWQYNLRWALAVIVFPAVPAGGAYVFIANPMAHVV